MRCVFTIALWLLSSSPALALPVEQDHPCLGRWVGEGQNSNSPTRWTIDLVMTSAPSGGRCGTIEYTRPTCGGTLESCQVQGEHHDIHTRELYTHNDGQCAPAGQVIIRCEGETMRYSWIGWERVDTILRRPPGWTPPPRPNQGPSPSPSPIPSPSPSPTPSPSPSPTPGPAPTQTPAPPPSQPIPPAATSSGCGCAVPPVRTSSLAPALVVLVLLRRGRSRAQRPVPGP